MRKKWIALACILLFQASVGDNLYVSKGNIFNGSFTDTYEKCIFVMYDGAVYVFTTRDEGEIKGPLSVWFDIFEKNGYSAGDIAIIMHNHFSSPRFSEADKKTYTLLKMMGFRGAFGIYVTATDKIYIIRETL